VIETARDAAQENSHRPSPALKEDGRSRNECCIEPLEDFIRKSWRPPR